MNITTKTCRTRLRLALNMIGITAAGTAVVSLASSVQVFAHHFLRDTTDMQTPAMVYSPELQIMVKPGTSDPVFTHSRSLPRGRANGEYRIAPLINCPGDPRCPRQPTSRVTPGGGPSGPGPTADSD
jgi:hypothetical protein